MKFLCLAYEEERVLDALTEAEWDALRRQTLDYVEGLRASGHLIDARPLQSAARATTVRVRDGRPSFTDGPFAETKEQLGGYFLIEAADAGEALRIAADWPSAKLGAIEVRPVDEALRPEGRYSVRPHAALQIRVDDLTGPEIAAFLEEHIAEMRSVSPPESKHALDLDGLRAPEITFWTAWDHGCLVGCGALKQLDPQHGEIKSMRTGRPYRSRGVAATMLQHIVGEARRRGYRRLSLETGAMPFFEAARRLYARHGFVVCAPFGSYRHDPNSAFMTLDL